MVWFVVALVVAFLLVEALMISTARRERAWEELE